MTNPYEPYDVSLDVRPSRVGCAVALVVLFALGFVTVLGIVFLRAPRGDGLGAEIAAPPGYVRLDDASAGGGPVSAATAASRLGVESVPGFQEGLSRAWGRAPGEPSRAVVVLVVRLDSLEAPQALLDSYRAASSSLEAIDVRDEWVGFHEPDPAGRWAQRVAFVKGDLFYVVSVVTPARESDVSEVLRLAERQS